LTDILILCFHSEEHREYPRKSSQSDSELVAAIDAAKSSTTTSQDQPAQEQQPPQQAQQQQEQTATTVIPASIIITDYERPSLPNPIPLKATSTSTRIPPSTPSKTQSDSSTTNAFLTPDASKRALHNEQQSLPIQQPHSVVNSSLRLLNIWPNVKHQKR
jgi:hypothetical protein